MKRYENLEIEAIVIQVNDIISTSRQTGLDTPNTGVDGDMLGY